MSFTSLFDLSAIIPDSPDRTFHNSGTSESGDSLWSSETSIDGSQGSRNNSAKFGRAVQPHFSSCQAPVIFFTFFVCFPFNPDQQFPALENNKKRERQFMEIGENRKRKLISKIKSVLLFCQLQALGMPINLNVFLTESFGRGHHAASYRPHSVWLKNLLLKSAPEDFWKFLCCCFESWKTNNFAD